MPIKPPTGASVDWSHHLSRGLAAFWLFNEGAGNIIKDVALKNNGVASGGPLWVSGKNGSALSLVSSPSDDKVTVPGTSSLNITGAITISAYIKTGASYGDRGRIIDNGKTLFLVDNTNVSNGLSYVTDGAAVSISAAGIIALNRWHHLVVTYPGGASVPSFYVNGVFIGLGNTTLAAPAGTLAATTIGNNAGNTRPFNGYIDNIRIYNRVLSLSEIQEITSNQYAGLVQQRVPVLLSVTTGTTYTLTCSATSFSATGQNSIFTRGIRLTSSVTNFSVTSVNALISYRRILTASVTSFTVTGINALFSHVRSLIASATSFIVTPQNAILTYTPYVPAGTVYTLTCSVTAFSVTAVNAGLSHGRTLSASVTAFSSTGIDAVLSRGYRMTASVTAFTATGIDALFSRSIRLTASVIHYIATGIQAGLTYVDGSIVYPLQIIIANTGKVAVWSGNTNKYIQVN